MAKYRINYQSVAHGAISWSHGGNDSQYCESGDPVSIDWQPTAGWGLLEAHYTDGSGNVTDIDLKTRTFTMPAKDITIGGTFKRFDLGSWADEGDEGSAVDVVVVQDIMELTEKQIKALKAGDVVVEDTGAARFAYTVNIKDEMTMTLVHVEGSYIERVYYSKNDGRWEYTATDVTQFGYMRRETEIPESGMESGVFYDLGVTDELSLSIEGYEPDLAGHNYVACVAGERFSISAQEGLTQVGTSIVPHEGDAIIVEVIGKYYTVRG